MKERFEDLMEEELVCSICNELFIKVRLGAHLPRGKHKGKIMHFTFCLLLKLRMQGITLEEWSQGVPGGEEEV